MDTSKRYICKFLYCSPFHYVTVCIIDQNGHQSILSSTAVPDNSDITAEFGNVFCHRRR